jgi:hypothetical protein
MHQTRIKTVIFLSLLGFFLGVVAISFHHHDKAFLLPTCSICKVKTSFSGTFSKIKLDSAPAVASLCFSLTAIFLSLSGILPDRKTVFVHSQIVETYPNKAPPFAL